MSNPTKQESEVVTITPGFASEVTGNIQQGNLGVEIKPRESPEERASRLRIAEAEATHKRRMTVAVLVVGTLVLFITLWMTIDTRLTKETQDKAWGVVTLILGALIGYLTGKNTK